MRGIAWIAVLCAAGYWLNTLPLDERAATMTVGLLSAIGWLANSILVKLNEIHLSLERSRGVER